MKALTTAQYGVVATRQLKGLGYNRASVARAAKAGRLERLHRGVYAVGHEALTWHGRCMAAVLACQPAVASHWTAAWLWGLLQSQPSGAFHLTARNARRCRTEFVVHSAALADEDVTAVTEHPADPGHLAGADASRHRRRRSRAPPRLPREL